VRLRQVQASGHAIFSAEPETNRMLDVTSNNGKLTRVTNRFGNGLRHHRPLGWTVIKADTQPPRPALLEVGLPLLARCGNLL
jgi:hypothetical protein